MTLHTCYVNDNVDIVLQPHGYGHKHQDCLVALLWEAAAVVVVAAAAAVVVAANPVVGCLPACLLWWP